MIRRLPAPALVGAALAGTALGIYAREVGPRAYESTWLSLEIPEWPPALDGLLVALVADIHVGRVRSRPWTCPALESAVEAVGEAKPDVLFFGGDFGFKQWTPQVLAGIADSFQASIRLAVLGNHDYARGPRQAQRLIEALAARGIRVLVNEVTPVTLRGAEIWVAGLGDAASGHADMPKLASSLPPDSHPAILLSHTPDGVLDSPEGTFDLALSGHTHGGQIAVPIVNHLVLRRTAKTRFDRGLDRVEGIPHFVTKGLGMVGYPARLRAKPEVAFLRLRSSGAR